MSLQFMCLKPFALSLKTKKRPTCSKLIYWHSAHFFILLYSFHNVPGVVEIVEISLLFFFLLSRKGGKKPRSWLCFVRSLHLQRYRQSPRCCWQHAPAECPHRRPRPLLAAGTRPFNCQKVSNVNNVEQTPSWFHATCHLPPATEHWGLFRSSWVKFSFVCVFKIKK